MWKEIEKLISWIEKSQETDLNKWNITLAEKKTTAKWIILLYLQEDKC